ncbi:UDP-N-acetylmuramoyl-L-alanyl-D-glutamate--2,6-diaminopimelate ligase [Candidatus Vallotia tarda]|uniref:UDP-N-acetylmuramoyl-L-alanyl-D-glutamate--2,6-diaminopimelate ligase n=1 Tax=Candidatus Vallotiella hemipterorum TaxID=1177213 RepID=A0A916JU37_9BURK|nr:UDP-N-acetylmuramoyl-L-alanyl-D-glutamate--2,6-diaminopimelate ligase [Candidatus Vallotia tarda]CAG7599230.1 UDP-N-acetylmuramoyl-L-alanyl-D-glutamate--2,6-diaminopimelate ligase [Candidatus Vallotia tarda]
MSRFPLTPEQIENATAEVLAWLRTRLLAPHAQLHVDSRAVCNGDVFISYTLDDTNSHLYIVDALQRGAAAVLVQAGQQTPINLPVLEIPELKQLAGYIASAWYGKPSCGMLVVGITGTNGKTTTNHWIAGALSSSGIPCAIIGTLGTGLLGHLSYTGFTTPDAPQVHHSLSVLRSLGAHAVSMEVSSHALHQERVNGVNFDIAVFTNLTQDHLDYHKDLASYESAKVRLFDWPSLRAAVINRDDEVGRRLIKHVATRVRVISYGISLPSRDSDASLYAIEIRAINTGTAFTVLSDWGRAEVEVSALGAFNVANLLSVLGVLLAADVPFDTAVSQLAQLEPVNGRMQKFGGRINMGEPLVIVDYAHTPDALEKTLEALRQISTQRGGKLICVFGCGGDRDAVKRPIMGAIAERLADSVIVTSDNPRSEQPLSIIKQIVDAMREPKRARIIEYRASAILDAVRAAAADDVVLIAGKGHETTQEVMGRKFPFSDQNHARLALELCAIQAQTKSE